MRESSHHPARPSPKIKAETVTATPSASNAGPQFAIVAGTRTLTIARTQNADGRTQTAQRREFRPFALCVLHSVFCVLHLCGRLRQQNNPSQFLWRGCWSLLSVGIGSAGIGTLRAGLQAAGGHRARPSPTLDKSAY